MKNLKLTFGFILITVFIASGFLVFTTNISVASELKNTRGERAIVKKGADLIKSSATVSAANTIISTSSIPCYPQMWPLGDMNKDGVVTQADETWIMQHFNSFLNPVLNGAAGGDLNGDTKVDTIDQLMVRAEIGYTCTALTQYTYNGALVNNVFEHQFFYGPQHFMTILIDPNGALALRPHPGLDINGWGSSLYLQPFLPGATLRGTQIQSITIATSSVNIVASGIVSRGASDSYGTWNGNFTFSYNPSQKDITGFGTYNINLAGKLNANTGDLNLYKLASNYLINVPLLNGTTGNTGDMQYVAATGSVDGYYYYWFPINGSSFPSDTRNPLGVYLFGNYNQVDTAKQGYAPIAAAYKPSITVILSPVQTGVPLTFGASYNQSQSQQYWQDNVGITPLILKSSSVTNYNFNVSFDSTAIAGDH